MQEGRDADLPDQRSVRARPEGRGARHRRDVEGAYAYLDAMLDKSAQEAFAVDMGYNPTVTNAVVAPDLNKRIGFTPEEVKKLVDLDYDYMNKNDVALKEWWDKELKS